MTSPIRILFVDDEPAYHRIFRNRVGADPRCSISTAASGQEALEHLSRQPADIVFADLKMPMMDGIELVTRIRQDYPDTFVLILTGDDSTAQVVKAMKAGAYDYLLKPLDFGMIFHAIETIISHRSAMASGTACLNDGTVCFESLIGQDRKMYEIYEKITQVAQTSATVLITGESGTGKELIASAIHTKSARRDKPFIQVNYAALTEGLVGSELFGHEKGAFTGAITRKKGFFEQASGGTLFLDEIGDISPTTQVALLRIMELGSFQRVGGSDTITADVRLICATNRDLMQAVRDKLFREDLYYRLNVVSLHAPPLRERKSDIPLLARHFLKRFCSINRKQVDDIAPDTLERLCSYHWPGNCRELANVIEHAVVFCKGSLLDSSLLPSQISKPAAGTTETAPDLQVAPLAQMERQLITKALQDSNWNLKKAAELLDIARGTLYGKMEKYGITKPD